MLATLPAFLNPVLVLLGLGLGLGALLGSIAKTFRLESDPVLEKINALLPQTQCGQCGYPGCRPYAEAIVNGVAINKCPPGGEATIANLANLLNVKVVPLDESYGVTEVRKVAFIREAECIGCAKCIPACPVDAILGAPKFMHTVIASECTGCDLCVEPCPVDCIDMIAVEDFAASNPVSANDTEYVECINCGLCVDECPVDILPHELYWACREGALEQAEGLKLTHCIECGKCNDVCPSHIPLVDFYQQAKHNLHLEHEDKQRADRARVRFESHQKRMEKMTIEEEQRRLKRAELAKQNRHQVSAKNIQAALARVKAKKESE